MLWKAELKSGLHSRRQSPGYGALSRTTGESGQWFRVKLDGPFVPGPVSRGHITYPGYEHLKWEAVVEKMEPERLFCFTWHPYAVELQKDYSTETPTLVEFGLENTPPERCFGSPSPASTKSLVSAAWTLFA